MDVINTNAYKLNSRYNVLLASISFYIFILNFERVSILPDFLLSKIAILFIIVSYCIKCKIYKINLNLFLHIIPIVVIFAINTINNLSSYPSSIFNYLHLPFLLNILIFIILCNSYIYKKNDLNLFVNIFLVSTFILAVCLKLNIGVNYHNDRASVFFLNSNIIGIHSFICIIFLIDKYINKKFTFFNILSIPFFLYLLYATASRTAFILLILSVLLMLFSSKSKFKKRKKKLIFYIIILSPFIILSIYESTILERFILTFTEGDISSRNIVWSKIISIFNDNYLIGLGQNKYIALTEIFGFSKEDGISPHNVFIEVFIYTGLIGFLLYIFFIYSIFKYAYFIYNSNGNFISLSFAFVLLGLSLTGQILEQKLPWVLMAYIFIEYYQLEYEKNKDFFIYR